jgi:hypothetical protein
MRAVRGGSMEKYKNGYLSDTTRASPKGVTFHEAGNTRMPLLNGFPVAVE